VFRGFRCWAQAGTFGRIFQTLPGDLDFASSHMDGTIIRGHPHGTGAHGRRVLYAIWRPCGLPAKIVASVDALGNLTHLRPLPGQRHASIGAPPLLNGL
jgi:hypothetical protein